MVFLNTLITGLQVNLINQTVGSSAHVWITGQSDFEQEMKTLAGENYISGNSDTRAVQLSDWENMMEVLDKRGDLKGISPLVDGNAFYTSASEVTPVLVKGFDQVRSNTIYDIEDKIVLGSSNYSGNNILVGVDFYEDNELNLGQAIKLTLPSGVSQSFVINGVFDLGNGGLNSSWIILDLKRAQKMYNYGNNISKLELQIKDVFDAEIVDASLQNRFSSVEVNNWIVNNTSLLAALQSQSSSSILIQVFVLLAITLGISSVLAVSVVQKSKQLGILKAMGTRNGQASRIFLLQGALLGSIGAMIGALFGVGLIKMFLWGTAISTGVPIFPLTVEYTSVAIIVAIAAVSSTLAAFLPAKRSSKLNPVEVIRNG
jgi:lipoprotein-releasing system permease protein